MSATDSQRPPRKLFGWNDAADLRAYAERVLASGDEREILPMACAVLFTLEEIERWRHRAEALENMIAGSAPLTWAATGDQDAAQKWEREALALIKEEVTATDSRQTTVERWARRVLGDETFQNGQERSLRVVEEAVELAQAVGVGADTLHRLVDYVYSRPVGDPGQEIAGTLVTLYAAAASLGVSADDEFAKELARIHTPEVEDKVRLRQSEKRAKLVAAAPPAEFVECAECAAKPGAPILCPSCLERRAEWAAQR